MSSVSPSVTHFTSQPIFLVFWWKSFQRHNSTISDVIHMSAVSCCQQSDIFKENSIPQDAAKEKLQIQLLLFRIVDIYFFFHSCSIQLNSQRKAICLHQHADAQSYKTRKGATEHVRNCLHICIRASGATEESYRTFHTATL